MFKNEKHCVSDVKFAKWVTHIGESVKTEHLQKILL